MALALLSACRGTVPSVDEPPELGYASVLIGCKIILPTGETSAGALALNLEATEESRSKEVYRLPLVPGAPLLYQVEPGTYKLAPTRGLFGRHKPRLTVTVEGRRYRVPFPREILRAPALVAKPVKIVAVGIVEATVTGRTPGREPTLKIRLDDSVDSRRSLVQDIIRAQMNPAAAAQTRSSAIAWTRALEQTLSELLTETRRAPAFRADP